MLGTLSKKYLTVLIKKGSIKTPTTSKVPGLADYCAEIQTIKIAQDKMEHAKVTMMNTFMDSAVQQYSKESGEWDIQLFKRHLASAADDDDVKM